MRAWSEIRIMAAGEGTALPRRSCCRSCRRGVRRDSKAGNQETGKYQACSWFRGFLLKPAFSGWSAPPLAGFVVLVGVMIALAGCSRSDPIASRPPAEKASLRKVTLQTDWFPQGEHGGYYQAPARGFYAQAGIEVESARAGRGRGSAEVRAEIRLGMSAATT